MAYSRGDRALPQRATGVADAKLSLVVLLRCLRCANEPRREQELAVVGVDQVAKSTAKLAVRGLVVAEELRSALVLPDLGVAIRRKPGIQRRG